jgi:hypothetical protein
MRRDIRALAAAVVFVAAMTAANATLAQKQGDILRLSHFDSPAGTQNSASTVGEPPCGIHKRARESVGNSARTGGPDGNNVRELSRFVAR